MMFKLTILLSISALCSSCNKTVSTEQSHTETTDEVTATKQIKAILIDVHSPREFKGGYLKNATNISHNEIAQRITELPTDKDSKIVLYCKSGGRAGMAKSTLKSASYTDPY